MLVSSRYVIHPSPLLTPHPTQLIPFMQAMSADGRAARRAELGLPLSSTLGIAAEGHVASSSSVSHPGVAGGSSALSPKRSHNHNSGSSSSSKYSSTGRVLVKPAGLEVNQPPTAVAGPSMLSLSTTNDYHGDDYGDDTLSSQYGQDGPRLEGNHQLDQDGGGGGSGDGGRIRVTPSGSDHPSPTYPPSPFLIPRPTQSPVGSAGIGIGIGIGVESVSAVRQSLTLLKTKTRR